MMKEKALKVLELYEKVMYHDQLVAQFFDIESEEDLDLKIEVLEKLANGTPPSDIPEYYDILELYPADGETWD